MDYLNAHPEKIDHAARLLREGGLVALPTETVYGLAACAENPQAIAKVFRAKGRPADHPLIVHLPDLAHLTRWACRIPPVAFRLAEAFWPGPLTLVLPAAPAVSPLITGGQDTVAVRWSAHPLFQAVLDQLGSAVVAPSANPFGHISPTSAAHVLKHMEGRIDAVLDGGDCRVGVESTILDLSGPEARILRPGCIGASQLAAYLPLAERPAAPAPRVPGALDSHYAPRLPCHRFEHDERAHLSQGVPSGKCAFIGFHELPMSTHRSYLLPADPAAYASQIYAVLHQAESSGSESILIEMPPDTPQWLHVRDRLLRASTSLG
ncbi:Sua5/YciO/YrdC/YwlC family protein [Pseudogulbenkiania sp. NH8B]|uniref:L-threonylcarbamoyladenylate synthase n=1 Tax=Pseudogulbenkiania sp. (strain NH8B) TaxID=748280 RepID=UPI0002279F85|nr:L-threonylcarbamoyladenylate synthase [Pseudogulbenkiania sp. NH8B]BAK77224.1 Sua5/YciO/YrdC/YwlC family protein [Pseudogulbenkiania sp. NH8B]